MTACTKLIALVTGLDAPCDRMLPCSIHTPIVIRETGDMALDRRAVTNAPIGSFYLLKDGATVHMKIGQPTEAYVASRLNAESARRGNWIQVQGQDVDTIALDSLSDDALQMLYEHQESLFIKVAQNVDHIQQAITRRMR